MVMGDMVMTVDVVVIGSGPGGYSAAFRAAELGLDVALVDLRKNPGGTYLYESCIPFQTYHSLTQLLFSTRQTEHMGIHFPHPEIDFTQINVWKEHVTKEITATLRNRYTELGILLIQGKCVFENSTTVRLEHSEISRLHFKHAIIATGSTPRVLQDTDPSKKGRILYPANALNITSMPKKILVVGGGITGLEIGSIYTAFGCHVHLAEQHTRILPDIDEDLIEPLIKQFTVQFGQLLLQTKINKLTESESDITVELETSQGSELRHYDYVIVATGQNAHSADLGIENTAIKLDKNGFIQTDEEQRTAESNIFAVGDVTGGNMLVHKAIGQGNVAAEVISGMPSAFDVRATPTIVYTTPQIAWCGLTEKKAQQQGVQITIEKVPWKHSSKAIITRSTEGMTKIISHKKDGRILGAGITGCNADELISEWVLAVEMGALAEDVALCLHGHPTLSEVGGNAADILFKRGKD